MPTTKRSQLQAGSLVDQHVIRMLIDDGMRSEWLQAMRALMPHGIALKTAAHAVTLELHYVCREYLLEHIPVPAVVCQACDRSSLSSFLQEGVRHIRGSMRRFSPKDFGILWAGMTRVHSAWTHLFGCCLCGHEQSRDAGTLIAQEQPRTGGARCQESSGPAAA
jgi:hypothetical protein